MLRLAVLLMTVAALVWLGYEFRRLIFYQGHMGAVDLKLRHLEVQRWAQGLPVYSGYSGGRYLLPSPFNVIWINAQLALWIMVGVFLGFCARRFKAAGQPKAA